MGWYWGVWVPGVFKLGHLQQAEPLLFWNVSNFFTFILGRPILITPEGQYGEKGMLPPPKLNETLEFECMGHQSQTIFSLLSKDLTIFLRPTAPHLYTGASFFITPQGQKEGKRDQNRMPTTGFECPGNPSWVICSRLSPFCSEKFRNFSLSCRGGQFLLSRRPNEWRKGNSSDSREEWGRGRSGPGAFILDHLQPFKLGGMLNFFPNRKWG